MIVQVNDPYSISNFFHSLISDLVYRFEITTEYTREYNLTVSLMFFDHV